MGENGVFVFPDAATGHAASSIDPNLLLALQNNGGFGGGTIHMMAEETKYQLKEK